MQKRKLGKGILIAVVLALVLGTGLFSQTKRPAPVLPEIRVESYKIQLTLDPDPHEMKAIAEIRFRAIQPTDTAVFQLSENLSVVKVTDASGGNLDFSPDDPGPATVSVHFPKQLSAEDSATIKMEYNGG